MLSMVKHIKGDELIKANRDNLIKALNILDIHINK